jgi:glycosyltransferase involved in cell wall biosynthesis
MKILWLCSWYPNPLDSYDGDFIQRHARALATQHPVTVLFVAQWGETVNVEATKTMIRDEEGVREITGMFRFQKSGYKWPDKLRYHICYVRFYKNLIRNYIRANGKPDLVHVHVPMKAGLLARWMKRKWNIPYLVSEQSSLYDSSAPGNFFSRHLWHRQVVRKIFADAAAVTNVSAAVGNILKREFRLPDVRVIHNTVNTNFFYCKDFKPVPFRFIHVSTLSHQKNVEGILKTAAQLNESGKNFELVIVGPVRDAQINLAVQLGLSSSVRFTGEISYPEVAAHMQQSSALVLFSRHENFPCVIPEALCCGLPCIAAHVGGVAEAIDESNGLLVQKENEAELFAAMNSMMDNYPQYSRKKISEAARAKYSYPAIGKQFYDLYREVLARC